MLYFLINPTSGGGKGARIWKELSPLMEARKEKYPYQAICLQRKGEAAQLAHQLEAHRPCTIVVIGGDGTINEVLNGLTSFEGITFSCIPTGSGNDFVRGLKLEKDPIRALDRILKADTIKAINIGQLTAGRKTASFGVSAGIGYDALVCDEVGKSRFKDTLNKLGLGKLIYTATALRLLLTIKRSDMTIKIDEETPVTYSRVYFAAAMNLPYEGGGFQFCPKALPDDGQLDLMIAHSASRLKVLLLLPMALFGRHAGHRGVDIIRCSRAEITACDVSCLHTDGEIPGYDTSVCFSLRPQTLQIIC